MPRLFAQVVAWILVSPTLVHAVDQDVYVLKQGHMECPKEIDAADLASASNDAELQSRAIKKIYSGACTSMSMSMRRIEALVKKTTANGGIYYCFHPVDLGVVSDQIECAPQIFVTTLKQELARRSGSFEIVGRGPFAIKAICAEGGFVYLFNRNGKWWRSSQVAPIEPSEVELPNEPSEKSLKAGCRGEDVN